MSIAASLRVIAWRDAADRLVLAEEARAAVENAGQRGPGKSSTLAVGRDGAGAAQTVPAGEP